MNQNQQPPDEPQKSKLVEFADNNLGGLEKFLKKAQVPEQYHKAIRLALDLRSKYGIILGSSEGKFQQEAIKIYKSEKIPEQFMGPVHVMVLEITRLWRNSMTSNN